MERVSTYKGSFPALIVVPHGHDDPNTAIIAESIVEEIDAYAVINRGWKRADQHDYYADKANCNNYHHIHEDVVREEFLDPILNYVERIHNKESGPPNIFVIHGVSNSIRQTVGGDALDVIIGYGEGKPPSYTCPIEFKHTFMCLLDKADLRVYQGKAGGAYSARRMSNIAQLFRTSEYLDEDVFTIQMEIIRELREDDYAAKETGIALSSVIKDTLYLRDYGKGYDSGVKFPYI